MDVPGWQRSNQLNAALSRRLSAQSLVASGASSPGPSQIGESPPLHYHVAAERGYRKKLLAEDQPTGPRAPTPSFSPKKRENPRGLPGVSHQSLGTVYQRPPPPPPGRRRRGSHRHRRGHDRRPPPR